MAELLLPLLLLFGVFGNAPSLADSGPDLGRPRHAPRFANSTAGSQPEASCRMGIDSCTIPAASPCLVSPTSAVTNGTASLPDHKGQFRGAATGTGIQASPGTLTSRSTATAGHGTLTDEPPVTLTALPSGVSLQTLDKATYTSPTYITTTYPGRNEPTIVPIIIPFVGPPMICFNCFINFPPNIKIDVPQFCIQLFGIKIGNCPPKDDDKNDDKEDDKEDDEGGNDENDADEKPTESEKQSTSTTSTSSSCTVTITATHRSVFCSVTKGNSAAPSCSTTAYTTATECSALGKTAAVTTTVTPTPIVPLCGPETCGGQVCPKEETAPPKSPAARALPKRGNPALGRWPDPADYPNHEGFIADQIDGIAQGTASKPRYNPKLVKHFDNWPISAAWVPFKGDVEALALQGLYGCTSIILVSRRGAWNKDRATPFGRLIDEYLPMGMNPRDPYRHYYEYGLAEMKDHPELGDAGSMFGDVPKGTDTPSSLNMRAYIVTPRVHLGRQLYVDDSGQVIPHAVLNNVHHQRGTMRAPAHVERLKWEIDKVYGDIPMEVLDYNAWVPKLEHTTRWDSQRILTDDHGTEYGRLRDYMAAMTRPTVRGKFLLQYQPAKTCSDRAEWRLWFEGQPVGDRADVWAPLKDQVFAPPASGPRAGKEQDTGCEGPVPGAPPGGPPTSAGGSDAGGSASRAIPQPTASVPSSKASGNPPLSGNHTLSSPQSIPAVPATLSTSASRIVHPPGSNPVPPTARLNTTTLGVPTTVSRPVLPPANATTPRAPATVDDSIDTIFTTVIVTVKPPPTRKTGLTAVPITTSTLPAAASTAEAKPSSQEAAKTTPAPSKPPPPIVTATSSAAKTTPSPSKPPPGPAPSQAVAIYYVDTVTLDYNKMLETEGAWWMFPAGVSADRIDHDPCGKEPQGWTFLDKPPSLESVPWPPSLDAEKHFFDQRYCKYKAPGGGGGGGGGGKAAGYGTLTCEHVAEFACERDPRASDRIECGWDPVAERTFVARVMCKFPTTDHRTDDEGAEVGSSAWVKTKVPLLGPP
ncbi:hypothetical protein LX36DRAFT_692716 [Colletotrichum falcatum]|nr:hypothetical protein LX36DRAFT_692716 [Colletotrichum falcatum]